MISTHFIVKNFIIKVIKKFLLIILFLIYSLNRNYVLNKYANE